MLRWMCGVMKEDKIRNEHVREPVTNKITEKRLKWYRHVQRRDEGLVLRRTVGAPVPGNRHRETQKNQVERLV